MLTAYVYEFYSCIALILKLQKIINIVQTDYISNERPYFDEVSQLNVTVNIGEITILKCRIKNKGNRTVCIKKTFV